MKGLVLEGGAMRGLFSVGVMDVLMEHGIRFDGAVGVSAGAAFGCNYKSRQPGRAIRYSKQQAREWRYCSLRSWILTGDLFGNEYVYDYMPNHVDIFDGATYDADPMEFHVVATDVDTGRPVYRRLDRYGKEMCQWLRASASMPVCSRIVHLDGMNLLDGGISDSIPLEYFERLGYDRNVVILTQPAGYVKQPNSAMPLMRLWLRRHPEIVHALATRHEMYNRQLEYVARAEAEGRALVIRPEAPLPIGHISHDPAAMDRVYHLGRTTAETHLPQLLKFL